MRLSEQYRPKTFSEVCGQDKAIEKIQRNIERQGVYSAWWISGKTGQGKTTIARILAGMAAHPFYTVETNGDDVSADKLREWVQDWNLTTLYQPQGHALIVNEAHGLRKPIVRRLLDLLETLPARTVVIFTTTKQNQADFFDDAKTGDAKPLLDRCIRIELQSNGFAAAMAPRLREIATKEGLNGRDLEAYVELMHDKRTVKGSARRALDEIADGRMV